VGLYKANMGRYRILRDHCVSLLTQDPHDEILLACVKKKVHNTKNATYILTRMSIRKLLRVAAYEKEDVWNTYAWHQAKRYCEHLFLQSRPTYMNYLYTGTREPFPDVRMKKSASTKTAAPKKKPSPVTPSPSCWINLSKDDIVAGNPVTPKPSVVQREKPSYKVCGKKETEETVCYTCAEPVKKTDAWGVAHLVYPTAGEELCNEKYNLRIVCNICHLSTRSMPVHAYLAGDGSYRCGRGLATKEYVTTLGRGMMIYYSLYGGRFQEE
jgi:hypothetical protein